MNHKEDVVNQSLWQVTVFASFQRARVYREHATIREKKHVRETLRIEIENLLPKYRQPVDEKNHIRNL